MFELCCKARTLTPYSLIHNPKPLVIEPELENALKKLLLYVPTIDSIQSPKIELMEDPLYDEAIFQYILSMMEIDQNSVLLLENNGAEIDQLVWDYYYDNPICTNCQKLIFTCYRKYSKTNNLLRHIRNIIAHGRFTVCNSLFVGFDIDNNEKKKAFLKFNPVCLVEALEEISINRKAYDAKVDILCSAFAYNGYAITKLASNFNMWDFRAEKGEMKFFVTLKIVSTKRFLHKAELLNMPELRYNNSNVPLLLVIDTAKLTKDAKEFLLSRQDLIVLDKPALKKFYAGEDVLSDEAERKRIIEELKSNND